MWQLLNNDLKMTIGLAAQKGWWVSMFLAQKLVFDGLFHLCSVLHPKLKSILCCFCWCWIELKDVLSTDEVRSEVALKKFLGLVKFLQYKKFAEKSIVLDIKNKYSDWIPQIGSSEQK